MRSIRVRTELALALALALSGCKPGVKPPIGRAREVPPERGGVLRTAFFSDVRSLDAATAFDTGSAAIEGLIYDTLMSYDDEGKLVPLLAESVDVAPDGRRYTLTLRRGVLMQDGHELRAEDVKRSLERALDHDTPCPVPSFYDRIEGYDAFHDGKARELTGVRVGGQYSVDFVLTLPDATFLHKLALPIAAPLCRSAGRKWSRDFSSRPCGAGPFRVVRFDNGQIIKLTRFDGYWQKGKPYLDGVDWFLSMQSYTQRFKFEDGALDYMREFNDADSMLYRSSAAWRGMGGWEPSKTVAGTFMNTRMAPFDDVHFRRAVAFAIDRQEIASVRRGPVMPQRKLVPLSIIPESPGYPGQHHDLSRALEEMRLAGYPYEPETGKGGYPETIEYLAIIDSFAQQAAELYQQQLARIGIRISIQVVGFPTFLARTGRENTVRMGFVGWSADYPDPSDFFEPILTTASIQPEDSQNSAFYSNPELDRLLVTARGSTDASARLELYRRAEQIVADDAPWAIAYSYRYFELWQPYLHGYRPNPILTQHLRGAWLDRSEMRLARARRRAPTTLALVTGRRSWSW
ncbi:MAG: ABC transporter substrate-binding protein [Sorangiineae bacterium]|nr:ABC transporter substrate-binding protein [Polyangiaceae bacterium]MEB2324898.1 ABC transporter substrate-binding protein [Sorangiineae bacterium]